MLGKAVHLYNMKDNNYKNAEKKTKTLDKMMKKLKRTGMYYKIYVSRTSVTCCDVKLCLYMSDRFNGSAIPT